MGISCSHYSFVVVQRDQKGRLGQCHVDAGLIPVMMLPTCLSDERKDRWEIVGREGKKRQLE